MTTLMLRSFSLLAAVARRLWPMTTLMLRSFSLLVAVARGLWPMTTLRGLWPAVLVETQATRPKTHRLDRLFLYKAGLLALPGGEW